MQRSILPIAVVSAVVGAGAAVGIVEGLGAGSGRTTTTLVQQAPLGSSDNASDNSDTGLTAGEIYKRDAPGVVFVRAQIVQRTQSPFDFGLPQEQQRRGDRLGLRHRQDRHHPHQRARRQRRDARSPSSSRTSRASTPRSWARTESTDLALLQVNPEGLTLVPLTLGSSKAVQVGDPAIAIGNPFGLERTLTTGVISAVQRTIQAPNSFEIDDVLQTDAPINPGNSGGPLIDATGKVIGINSQIATGGSGSRQRRHRLRRADRHRQEDHPRPQAVRARGPRLPRDRRADHRQDAEGRTCRSATARSCRRSRPAARPTRRASAPATSARRSTATRSSWAATSSSRSPARTSAATTTSTAAVADRTSGERIKVTLVRGGKVKTVEVTLGERPNTVTAGQP